jgi:hypothetical protein
MERDTQELVERLQRAYGEGLLSVILYGSGAAGDRQPPYSDVNVYCVLKQVTPAELALAGPIFRWWRGKGNPAPLLMSEQEMRRSTDCFPMEFHDMQECRQLLAGRDLIAEIQVDDRHYRTQVEYELRSKYIRLRQKSAGVLDDPAVLMELMSDSVATFLVVARHLLRLRGMAPVPVTKREVVQALARHEAVDVTAFERLLARRAGEKIAPAAAQELFGQYVKLLDRLVEVADAVSR